MRKLKSNIIFNFLGSAWLGILTLAVTPIQVYFLGVEAFGLVRLITILQVLLGTLDLGISATVTKVVSSDHSEQHRASANAVNTASTVYWFIALVVAVVLWMNSDKMAGFWLSRTKLDPATVTSGIQIIAVYLGLRWPVAFYTGVINGLQRMDVLNLVKAGVNTLRLVGGVVVLFFWPDLVTFLVWFAISSAVELPVYIRITYRLFPALRLWPIFSLASFKDIWRYSAAMNLVALTALVLSQADRLAVMKFLSLEALGYYSIAYNASIVISLVQSAINSATFPAYSHSFSSGRYADLLLRYGKASQLMGFAVGLPCFLLIFFGHEILQIWINMKVADEVAFAMLWLALGFFINSMISGAHMLAMACGKPNLSLKVNLLAVLLYLPALYWVVPIYGINGAAAAYAGLTLYYAITLLPMVQARILRQGTGMWLWTNFLPFVFAGTGAFGIAKLLALVVEPGWQTIVVMVLGFGIYMIFVWIFLSSILRADLRGIIISIIR